KSANSHYQETMTRLNEVTRLRKFRALPGKGSLPENRQRLEMTEAEKEDLQERRKFLELTTPEERAADVLERYSQTVSPDQRSRLQTSMHQRQLIESLSAGDRSVAADEAVRGHTEILEMAIRKGVYEDRKKISDL